MNPLVDDGSTPRALLALEDGSTFFGLSAGAEGESFGEVVFNTSMTGYQEIVSDPSYAGQIVTLTYPQVGNYGVSDEAMPSPGTSHLRGLVVRDMCRTPSSWTSAGSLPELLRKHGVVAIEGVDTRALTLADPRQGRDAGRRLDGRPRPGEPGGARQGVAAHLRAQLRARRLAALRARRARRGGARPARRRL